MQQTSDNNGYGNLIHVIIELYSIIHYISFQAEGLGIKLS